MSDRDRNDRDPIFVTLGLGNNDLSRITIAPSTQEDGGKTSEVNAHLQRGERIAGLNYNIFTSHFDVSTYRVQDERQAYGSFEAYAGRTTRSRTFQDNTSLFGQVQADVSYNDTHFTPRLHQWVHDNIVSGRDVRPEYARSTVPNELNVGVSGMGEWRREGLQAGSVEFKPSVFVAGAAGTNRLEGAVGARVAVGHNVDGTPRPLPTANPEAPGATYVRDPGNFRAGNWSIGATISQYRLEDNRYLQGGERERRDPWRAALDATVNVRDNISLGASLETYSNPVRNNYRLNEGHGPARVNTARVSATLRF